MLLRSPGFTAVALLAITLGMPQTRQRSARSTRRCFIRLHFPTRTAWSCFGRAIRSWASSAARLRPASNDWREQNQTFEHIVIINQRYFDLTERDEPERFFGYVVSSTFFDALGVRAMYGRTFSVR